jgi:hypothetical protein
MTAMVREFPLGEWAATLRATATVCPAVQKRRFGCA